MKGIQGILIAVGLGVVGAVCNWLYISKKARDLDKEWFVVIKSDARISRGDAFRESHFERVAIPRRHLGNLDQIAVKWEDRATVFGFRALKSYTGNELLLHQDLRSEPVLPLEQKLRPGEAAIPVMVDSRTFVAENFNPNDEVYLLLPPVLSGGNTPTEAAERQIGPFRILAIGERMGSREVREAAGKRTTQENVITVAVGFQNGAFDEKGQKLREFQRLAGNQGLQVMKSRESESGSSALNQ